MTTTTREPVKRIEMFIHVAELAAENDIVIRFDNNLATAYWARPRMRMISTRPIRNTGYYVSALHELGHILGTHQEPDASRYHSEIAAWRWAWENALLWTETADRIMHRALRGYYTDVEASCLPQKLHEFMEQDRIK
jgi:hypothetical protein